MSAGKAIGRQRELPKHDLDRNHAPVPTAKLAKRQCFRLVNTETGRKFIDAAREGGTVPSALLVARSATRLGMRARDARATSARAPAVASRRILRKRLIAVETPHVSPVDLEPIGFKKRTAIRAEAALAASASGRRPGRCPAVGGSF